MGAIPKVKQMIINKNIYIALYPMRQSLLEEANFLA